MVTPLLASIMPRSPAATLPNTLPIASSIAGSTELSASATFCKPFPIPVIASAPSSPRDPNTSINPCANPDTAGESASTMSFIPFPIAGRSIFSAMLLTFSFNVSIALITGVPSNNPVARSSAALIAFIIVSPTCVSNLPHSMFASSPAILAPILVQFTPLIALPMDSSAPSANLLKVSAVRSASQSRKNLLMAAAIESPNSSKSNVSPKLLRKCKAVFNAPATAPPISENVFSLIVPFRNVASPVPKVSAATYTFFSHSMPPRANLTNVETLVPMFPHSISCPAAMIVSASPLMDL